MDPFPTDRNSELASLTLIILTLCAFATFKFVFVPSGRIPNHDISTIDYSTQPLHVDPPIYEASP
jgi:hypothetical protein